MAKLSHFSDFVAKMQAIHAKKNSDYASKNDPLSNFKYAAMVAAPFTDEMDKIFAGLLGIKMARLAQLKGKEGRVALNESIEDSHLDLATYAAIWGTVKQ